MSAFLLSAVTLHAQQNNADTLFITEDGIIQIGGPTRINEGLSVTGYFYVGSLPKLLKT